MDRLVNGAATHGEQGGVKVPSAGGPLPAARCPHDAAYLAGHAAEVPVKSAQELSGGAPVAPVDLPEHRGSPAEGLLLRGVLEREMPDSRTLALFCTRERGFSSRFLVSRKR